MSFIVKNTTFPGLLDLLAPHSCRGCGLIGAPLCNRCKKYIISERLCFEPKLPKDLPPIFVAASRDGLIGKLIHDLKYKSVRDLARPLAEILDEILPEFDCEVRIVPLPTIGKHIRERGLDHTYLVARELAKIRQYKVQKVLRRTRSTVQVGSGRKKRLKQAAEAYEINVKQKINSDALYLLLDDVWTTGATMKAAIKKMQTLEIKKIVAVLMAMS